MRIRIRYRKIGKVRFTSHRDVARCWERAFRISGLPIASTEGFSPRPKMHFGLALSTSHESLGEYLDLDLRDPESVEVDLVTLPESLSSHLPEGIDIDAVAVIDRSEPSLQESVTSCTWQIEVPGVAAEELIAAVARVLSASTLPVVRERKGRQVSDDLRPGIVNLEVHDATPIEGSSLGAVLYAELATQPRSVRPSELMAVFDPPLEEGRVRRIHQFITDNGATREPLPPGAPSMVLTSASTT
jgi:radical SAM-linked protein